MKVCFVAQEFPPINTGGSHRPSRFCRGLPKHDIEPVVYTVSNHDESHKIDHTLLERLPPTLKIHRSAMRPARFLERPMLGNYLSVLDPIGARWETALVKQLDENWHKDNYVAVFATAPPFSVIRLGAKTATRYGVPLIIDLRDAWSQWCITPYATPIHYYLTRYLEGALLSQAHSIIVPTEQVGVDLAKQHPQLKTKIVFIPNGFEENIVQGLGEVDFSPKRRLIVGYAGNFYFNPISHRLIFDPWYRKKPYQYLQYCPRKEDWSYRSPLYFLLTMKKLFEIEPRWRRRLTLRIAGHQPDVIKQMPRDLGLDSNVEFVGRINKMQMQNFYQDIDFTLSTSVKVLEGRDYCIAGKTYESITHGLPILAFTCEGQQSDFLRLAGVSIHFNPDTPGLNAQKLLHLFENGASFQPNKHFLANFEPNETTRKLANTIKSHLPSP